MRVQLKSVQYLNEVIVRNGFSKRSFAKAVGVGHSTMMQIFNRTRNPSPRLAKMIVDTLNLEWDDLFSIVPGEQREGGNVGRTTRS